MLIVLLRHGETAYNAQRRYQGKSDIPLSARGRARLRAADFAPDVVFGDCPLPNGADGGGDFPRRAAGG